MGFRRGTFAGAVVSTFQLAQFANRRLGASRCEAGSRRRVLAEHDEMKPPRTAVQVLGRDAMETLQEALDLAVAAVDRLDVQGAAESPPGTVDCKFNLPISACSTPSDKIAAH